MKPIKVLDASLRDGGHRNNFHFSDEDLQGILVPLDNSGVDYIEIGYRNGSIIPIDNIGRAGLCDKAYLLNCHSLIKNSKIAVMAHPQNVNQEELAELKACGVTLLRVCVLKGELETAFPVMELAKKENLEVSFNFIHLSYYSDDELAAAVKLVAQHQPDMIYFADSNGSLFPEKIKDIYQKFTNNYSIPFGFHAHDNLGLAQANSLAALSAGADYIDGSLAGMGKGIGNLKTEFFLAYLQAMDVTKYKLDQVLAASNYVRGALKIGSEPVEMDEFIRGISDLSTADLKLFKAR